MTLGAALASTESIVVERYATLLIRPEQPLAYLVADAVV